MPPSQRESSLAHIPFDFPSLHPGHWERVARTLLLFLQHPLAALGDLEGEGTEPDSFTFLLSVAWPLQVLELLIKHLHPRGGAPHPGPLLGPRDLLVWDMIATLVFFPLSLWIAFKVYAALVHWLLRLWEGPGDRLMLRTARAFGFTSGVVAFVFLPVRLLSMNGTPLGMGLAIQWIFSLTAGVYLGLALAKAHHVRAGRAIAASLTLPVLLGGLMHLLALVSRAGTVQ